MASGDDRESWRSALAVSTLGLEMGLSVAVGWWFGTWLDEQLGTGPWLMYAWVAIGILAAFRALWRVRKHWPKDEGP